MEFNLKTIGIEIENQWNSNSIPLELKLKTIGIETHFQWNPNSNQSFHFFNTLYYICQAVTYSFTITYLEYFMVGNFKLKISTICIIHAKFKQYKIFPCKLF